MRHVHVVAAQSALSEHRRDVGRERARALARRIDHHARQTRRQRQTAERLTFRRDAVVLERAQVRQQRAGLGERALRRRIEKRKRLRRRAPGREVEHEG